MTLAARLVVIAAVLAALVLSGSLPVSAQNAENDAVTLQFDQPEFAILNAREWDATHQQWAANPEEMFYDAVHRFLLLRFPGCAEALYARLAEGYEIASAHLQLQWQRNEWVRVEGYSHRGWGLPEDEPPQWHTRARLLRRPWAADPQVGPTWNAYVNGAGYWRAGGALDPVYDSTPPLGEAELWEGHPTAELDLTAALTDPRYGATPALRLRIVESCGFLLQRSELYERKYGENFGSTGAARIWIENPKLIVTLRPAARPAPPGELPPAPYVPALAAEIRARGGDGVPPTRLPENWPELAPQILARPAGLPDWMWDRIQEVRDLRTYRDESLWEYGMLRDLASGDPEVLATIVDRLLQRPPGWFMGHSHIDFLIPILAYDHLLPEVIRYHLRKFSEARWLPPYDETLLHHRVSYYAGMATLNHQSSYRCEAVLAAEVLGLSDLLNRARYARSLQDRQMIHSEGVCQEHGDSFYLGISITQLQTLARYSVDPLTRLQASLAVEKLLAELNDTYHPGLRRQVSTISRRYGMDNLIMQQDVPRAILHTLSPQGVLIQKDEPEVHGIQTLGFGSCPPVRVALLAPWGQAWEAGAVDGKPLPYRAVGTNYVRGHLSEPLYHVSYLDRNYALASMNVDLGAEFPLLAAWRREARPVDHLDDLGLMFIMAQLNDKPLNRMGGTYDTVGTAVNPPIGVLQHGGKLIYTVRMPERPFLEPAATDPGLTSFTSRVSLYAYGPDAEREIWVGDRQVAAFPLRFQQGEVLTLKEGVTYLGLIPLPATDLGREHEVVMDYTPPLLTVDSYLLDRDDPLPLSEETWEALGDALGGWIVELGDEETYGSFEAFRRHMHETQLATRWEPEARTLHVSYTSGEDTLELGVMTTFQRRTTGQAVTPPSALLAYQRINGQWPWPDRRIDRDSPLVQMGTAARLQKGGAILETLEGQTAMLRVEPHSGTYTATTPLLEPQPLQLITPEDWVLRGDGPLTTARIAVCPRENSLWVDYHLPPPGGDRPTELLQFHGDEGALVQPEGFEPPISRFFRPGADVRWARRDAARGLLLWGPNESPRVILNGEPLAGPFPRHTLEGKTWFRVPLAR